MEERISAKFLRDAQAVPLREDDEELALAIADPTDSYVLSAVQMASGKRVRPYIAAPNEIDAALERLYGGGQARRWARSSTTSPSRDDERRRFGDIEHLKDLASEAPVIRLVNLLLTKALESRASDIHIEPFENRLIVRYRIDGVLHEVESPPRRLSAAVISPREDHGLARHRRAAPAAGRAHQAAHPGQGDRPARLHRAHDARRERRDADPRQGRRAARLRLARLRGQGARALHPVRWTSRTASCSSRAPRAAARPPRSTRRSTA